MRNIIVVLFLLVLTTSYGQRRGRSSTVKWLNIALKGGVGGTMLFNSDVSSDENTTMNFLSPSNEVGARFGITYGDYVNVGVEYLMSGMSQKYQVNPTNMEAYEKTQAFKMSDILFTIRFQALTGFYFEVGPKFSTVKSASIENSITGSFNDETATSYEDNFSDKFTSIVVGMGLAVFNGERVQINLGLRGSYALSDLNGDGSYFVLSDGVYSPVGPFDAETKPFTLKFTLGVNYIFGFWGDASCGRGRLMFFQ